MSTGHVIVAKGTLLEGITKDGCCGYQWAGAFVETTCLHLVTDLSTQRHLCLRHHMLQYQFRQTTFIGQHRSGD